MPSCFRVYMTFYSLSTFNNVNDWLANECLLFEYSQLLLTAYEPLGSPIFNVGFLDAVKPLA